MIELALTFDDITAITRKYYMPKFPQLAFDQNLVQKQLAAKGTKPTSGESIQQPVMYQNNKGGAYNPYDTFDISAEQQVTAANFNWKYYEVPITISRDELLKNKGPEGVKKLMDAKMKMAALKMGDLLAVDMFALRTATQDSAKEISSLENMLNDAADSLGAGVTYGGIAKDDYSWWAGKNTDGGGTAGYPTYDILNGAYYAIADGNIQPNLIPMHNNSMKSFLTLNQDQQRYYKQSEMDAGFMTASFNGKTVVADLHVSDTASVDETANRVYFLNTDFIDFVCHADENNRLEPFAKPVDQAVGVAHIMFAGELTSSDCSRSGALENFDSIKTSA